MGELRAILLGCAVGCLALIWWWTARNSRQGRSPQPARESAAAVGGDPVGDPPEAETAGAERVDRDWGVSPLEPLSIKTADFDRVPILEMPMMADVKSAARPAEASVESSAQIPPVLTQVAEPEIWTAPRTASPPSRSAAPPSQTTAPPSRSAAPPSRSAAPPSQTTAPSSPTASAPLRTASPAVRTDDSDRFAPVEPRSRNASERQRIITIRVCAVGEAQWSGSALIAALESQGLAYGKYKIYHRRHADGRSLFSVASLVEPGTFDLEQMPNQAFRGLALFAVLPGPAEPLQTVEALLATARGLAEDLSAKVEDAQGLPLSPLRAAALREDVVRFQAQLP